MADVIIRVSKNGPYEVEGGAKLFDHQGKSIKKTNFPLSTSAAAAILKTSLSATVATKPQASKPRRPPGKLHQVFSSFELE